MSRKKILFITNSEHGQANVMEAVVYELLLLRKYQIHIASFAQLGDRVKHLNSLVDDHDQVTFHTIVGPCMVESFNMKNQFMGPFRPGILGSLNTARITIPVVMTCWNGPKYMDVYQNCRDIIESVDPDLIVVDNLFNPGLEACQMLKRDIVVLSPNTYQELLQTEQSLSRQFFKYPALASGFRYPIAWYLIPINIFLRIMTVWYAFTTPLLRDFFNFRKSQNLPMMPPMFTPWQKGNTYLVPSLPETDFPTYIPTNVFGCGPLLLPSLPVSQTDPKLQSWLEQHPTLMVNLGTLARIDEAMVREIAIGLKRVLDIIPDLQVLWKLKRSGGWAVSSSEKAAGDFRGSAEIGDECLEILSHEIAEGRVVLTEWMSADPLAILQTGHIVCSVNHGGSNSFHEALSVGVPQVILPCWLDTIDFADRVEWLGIGLHGSRSAVPGVEGMEFSEKVLNILKPGPQASKIRARAKELGELSQRAGGRRRAAKKIEELLEGN